MDAAGAIGSSGGGGQKIVSSYILGYFAKGLPDDACGGSWVCCFFRAVPLQPETLQPETFKTCSMQHCIITQPHSSIMLLPLPRVFTSLCMCVCLYVYLICACVSHVLLQFTMQEVQGGIIGSGLIVFFIGATGIIQPILRTISPITVAANIGVLVRACVMFVIG